MTGGSLEGGPGTIAVGAFDIGGGINAPDVIYVVDTVRGARAIEIGEISGIIRACTAPSCNFVAGLPTSGQCASCSSAVCVRRALSLALSCSLLSSRILSVLSGRLCLDRIFLFTNVMIRSLSNTIGFWRGLKSSYCSYLDVNISASFSASLSLHVSCCSSGSLNVVGRF